MSDALRLVAEVNAYLDTIDESNTCDESRIQKLEELKAAMLRRNFNAPFIAMLAQTRAEMDEDSAEDLHDKSKQVKRIRYIASLKKFTLNRTRVALASHKLARALGESGRSALVPYLPFGGSYVKALSERGEMAAEAYHLLMSLFTPRKFNLSTASAVIKAGESGKEKELDLGGEEDPAGALKKILGKSKGIQTLTLQNRPSSLIKNHSTRVALFTMAACASERKAAVQMEEEGKKDEKLAQYNAILHRHGIVPDVDISHLQEGMPKLVDEAQKAGFVNKTKGGDYFLEERLELALHKRRARRRQLVNEGAREAVFGLMMWYYIHFNAQGRESYGAMPAVLAKPDERQLHALKELKPDEERLIKHPDRLVAQKLLLEERAPPLPSAVWGPAFVAAKTGQKAGKVAEWFGADAQAVEAAVPLVKGLLEQPEGRGAKFLQGLKKKG